MASTNNVAIIYNLNDKSDIEALEKMYYDGMDLIRRSEVSQYRQLESILSPILILANQTKDGESLSKVSKTFINFFNWYKKKFYVVDIEIEDEMEPDSKRNSRRNKKNEKSEKNEKDDE